ncbi:MAG: SAM-dependent methyltransferase, partial [Deltaproteobacteria bacterium]|nr:SAM-dependent methyltransferase [Deltaproteobacteria bacterium]
LEHILNPEKAFAEIARTLKRGGAHVFTVPWYFWKKTVIRAVGTVNDITHLKEPKYHKNPVNPDGSLVTREWGADLTDFIFDCSGMSTTIIRQTNRKLGIGGKFIEVFISKKPF